MNPTVHQATALCRSRAEPSPRARALCLLVPLLAMGASAQGLELDVIDARLTYVDTPGLTAVSRSNSASPTGSASPQSDGEVHPHARRGYSIEAGAFVGSTLWPQQHAGVLVGVSVLDSIAGGTFSGGSAGPAAAGVTKEDLDAFAIKLHVGPYLTVHAVRLELMPFIACGPSRGTVYATTPPATGAAASLQSLFGNSAEVHSDIGTYLAYGAQLGAYFEPHISGSFLVGAGVGYEAFRSRVHFSTNAVTGSATDVLSGHGLDLFLSVGGRF